MPTYEYECTHCRHRFEVFQVITDPPLKRCPECRHKVRRLLGTGAGIIFKGSGFYQTDYRSKNYHADSKRDKPADGTKSAGETKGDTKPGAKNEAKTDTAKKDKNG